MLMSFSFFETGKRQNSMKIVNIEGENLHMFRTTRGNLTKFSGNMWLMLILKVIKKQGSLSL